MFDNIGKKIKFIATAICWTGILASVIFGCATMESSKYLGFAIVLAGFLISWVSSFVLYGYGQLIDNSDKLVVCFKKLHEEYEEEVDQDEEDSGYYTEEDFIKDMQQERAKDFLTEIKETKTSDLKIILQDQKDLYSQEEINIIEKELETRINGIY